MRKYMMSGNLWKRLERLEKELVTPETDWGLIYDTVRAMDRSMMPPNPDDLNDDFDREFIERNGTREEFIEAKRATQQTIQQGGTP